MLIVAALPSSGQSAQSLYCRHDGDERPSGTAAGPPRASGRAGSRKPMAGLLDDIRVVEVAHPHTEYAGLVLAGLGAEV